MCLYTKQKEPKIAEKDITCYKVLKIWDSEQDVESGRKRKSKKTVLKSMFYSEFTWNIGKHYRSRLVIEPRQATKCCDNFNSHVDKAFHSYQTLESAKLASRNIFLNSYVIVRCIIPKGAKYCEGMNCGDSQDGYASNQIIMKEILGFEELYPYFDSDKYPYKQGQFLFVSNSAFPNGEIVKVHNIIPLDSNTVRLKLGVIFYIDTDINGIPVSPTDKIQVYNNKEAK